MEECKGLLRTIRVRDTDEAIKRGWHVILIVRSPGPLQRLVDDGRLEHMPDLSPSQELLKKIVQVKKEKEWDEQTFQNVFVPEFLEESEDEAFRNALNNLYSRIMQGERIALTCFCELLVVKNYELPVSLAIHLHL